MVPEWCHASTEMHPIDLDTWVPKPKLVDLIFINKFWKIGI
jgi:hypothetical protein